MFKFNLAQKVSVIVSGETGHVKGRAEFIPEGDRYFLHMKAADGRAVDCWFDESEIKEADIQG